jgi:hypothetical protein
VKGAGKDDDEVKVADISMHLLEALEHSSAPMTQPTAASMSATQPNDGD